MRLERPGEASGGPPGGRSGLRPRMAGGSADIRQGGVTLVELVIAVFLGGMVFLGLGYVFALNYGLWMRGQSRMVLHAGASRALEEIVRTAGAASGFSLQSDGELRVFSPPSPAGGPGASEEALETWFRLQDHRLLRNGESLVPHSGDSTLGVAAFEPRLVFAEGTGIRTLQVRLSLYTRETPTAAAETLHFETAAHARNAGLGLSGGSGASAGRAESGTGRSGRARAAL